MASTPHPCSDDGAPASAAPFRPKTHAELVLECDELHTDLEDARINGAFLFGALAEQNEFIGVAIATIESTKGRNEARYLAKLYAAKDVYANMDTIAVKWGIQVHSDTAAEREELAARERQRQIDVATKHKLETADKLKTGSAKIKANRLAMEQALKADDDILRSLVSADDKATAAMNALVQHKSKKARIN